MNRLDPHPIAKEGLIGITDEASFPYYSCNGDGDRGCNEEVPGAMIRSALNGKRVVMTRAAHQLDELASALVSRGAIPVAYPCIAIAPPEDARPLDAALDAAAAGTFDWLVLTSANAAVIVGERLQAAGTERLSHLKVAAVGAATAGHAETWLGRPVDCLPPEGSASSAAGAAEVLAGVIQPGMRVLLAASEIARPELRERLTEIGAEVTAVTAYRTVIGEGGADLPTLLRAGQIDAVTFASPSAAHHFLIRLAQEGGRRADLAGVTIACIGGTTARAAESAGLRVDAIAREPSMTGLVEALDSAVSH